MNNSLAQDRQQNHFAALRQKAKSIMSRLESARLHQDIADSNQLLEELNVYHIELELQHEEIQKTRDRLEASKKYLDALFKNAPLGYVVMDTGGKILDMNNKASVYFQVETRIFIGQRLQSFIPHDSISAYNDCLNALLAGNVPANCEVMFRVHGGSSFYARVDLYMVENPKDGSHMILCSIMDVSSEKQAKQALVELNGNLEKLVEERTEKLKAANETLKKEVKERQKAENKAKEFAAKQESLTHEINHRVKNNMQIMLSLMKLQAKKTSDPGVLEAVMENQSRIKALSVIHDALSCSADSVAISFSRYLEKLAKNIILAYGQDKIRIKIESDIKNLHIDQALPIGIVMTELITNAVKYAFPDGKGGEITISADLIPENQVRIIVRDNGIGIKQDIDVLKVNSLGLHLVHRLVEGQLKGTVEFDGTQGTHVIITFSAK